MNITDPIADMLTRIRNAQAVGKESVVLPYSRIKEELAKILLKNGLLNDFSVLGRIPKKEIKIDLKYENNQPKISGLKRISKPGQRIYKKHQEINPIKQGWGLAIISTSQGLMTDKEVRKLKIGGEVICEIW